MHSSCNVMMALHWYRDVATNGLPSLPPSIYHTPIHKDLWRSRTMCVCHSWLREWLVNLNGRGGEGASRQRHIIRLLFPKEGEASTPRGTGTTIFACFFEILPLP